MDIFLDTSFILSLIIRTEKTEEARKFYMEATFNPVASVAVYEESLYTGLRLVAEKRLNIKNAYSLRNFIKKNPNDALIAATCKHYGIRKIATFDEDFKRVDFLEIVRV